MAKIRYIEHDGTVREFEVQPGFSVMQGATRNGVHGVIAECGGACSCATCHVYVDAAWLPKVGAVGELEAVLLEEVCEVRPNSRLSCQISVTEALDGLVVQVPAKQV
jgi:ferredoxin, 2Fe-2S